MLPLNSITFADLHPTTRRLLIARALRSVGQGALVVDLALYLNTLGWDGVAIGGVLTGAGLFGAALTLLIGQTSDQLRRKPFLLVYEGVALLCSLVALLTSQTIWLAGAIVLAGFGRGANGAAGPFSPAEQAWLAEEVPPSRRGRVYSLNTALGFFGMGVGALIAMLPALWSGWLSGALAYRPLFALAALSAVGNLVLLGQGHESYRGVTHAEDAAARQREAAIRHDENRILRKLVFVNGFNGLAIGLTGPLISYWFALRFGVGPAEIAPVMAVTFFMTSVSSWLTGWLTEHIGIVKSIVWVQFLGMVSLALLPLMPAYWLASLVYLLRSAFSRGSLGARQALTIGLVRDERRGLATSLNAVSFQLPQSVGPSVAGYLLDADQFALPFFIGAFLQAIYLVAYDRVFRRYEPPRETVGSHAQVVIARGADVLTERGDEDRAH